VLRDLARAGIKSVLIEGGGRVAASALRERLVDRIALFVAPKLLGGDGRPMIARLGLETMKQALAVRDLKVQAIGGDLLIEGRPAFRKSR
jgi:diaminohydroxyphosphoribosylaminopyrimidine deaminase/5-amino-6-(5-phosphoribosylamino)uracil reductase